MHTGLYYQDGCKAPLWAPARDNTCGSCWLGTARQFSHNMRWDGGLAFIADRCVTCLSVSLTHISRSNNCLTCCVSFASIKARTDKVQPVGPRGKRRFFNRNWRWTWWHMFSSVSVGNSCGNFGLFFMRVVLELALLQNLTTFLHVVNDVLKMFRTSFLWRKTSQKWSLCSFLKSNKRWNTGSVLRDDISTPVYPNLYWKGRGLTGELPSQLCTG